MGFSGERCARKPWEQQLEAMDLGAGHTGRRTVAPAPVAQIGLITSVNRAIDRKPGFFLRRCQKGRSLNMRGGGVVGADASAPVCVQPPAPRLDSRCK